MNVLVTYATFAGSTGGVAELVGETLAGDRDLDAEIKVDVRPVGEVTDVDGYEAVVVGTAIRAGQIHPDAMAFLEAHAGALSQIPVAYFVVCLTMREDTEENRCTVSGYLDAVHEKVPQVEPVSVALFPGALDYGKLPFFAKLLLKAMRAPEGDFRDWEAVQAWAAELRPKLLC
jgi:menaquinone-dependent protoporphyrinogen oxidase